MKFSSFYTLLIGTLISLGAFLGCRTQYNSPDEADVAKIYFGSGGGVVGSATTYVMLENGQIFRQNTLDGPFESFHSVSKRAAKGIFATLEEQQLSQFVINQPGNLYKFVRWTDEQGKYECVWGDHNTKVDPAVEGFYQTLMEHTFPKQ